MSNAFTADRERDVKTSIRKVEYPCRECGKTVCVYSPALLSEDDGGEEQ